MSGKDMFVPRKSKKDIEAAAEDFAKMIWPDEGHCLDVKKILFELLPEKIPGLQVKVVPDSEMHGNLAMVNPVDQVMRISENTNIGLSSDNRKARFTVCHEIGHLLLKHGNQNYARSIDFADIRKISERSRSSEWQANKFAAAILMPAELVDKAKTPRDLAEMCMVSVSAAENRMRDLDRWPPSENRSGERELPQFVIDYLVPRGRKI